MGIYFALLVNKPVRYPLTNKNCSELPTTNCSVFHVLPAEHPKIKPEKLSESVCRFVTSLFWLYTSFYPQTSSAAP
jgi:hypothetical protein